jgi:TolB-like protein
MTLSTSSSNKIAFFLLTSLLFLSGCASTGTEPVASETAVTGNFRIAVYPVTNLSGVRAPLKETRRMLSEMLRARGVAVLGDAELETFLARHRIRYLGGLTAKESEWLKDETAADAVLICSLEHYNEVFPPKIALTARLVSTGIKPVILWAGSEGLAGDDSEGILGLGLIEDSKTLLEKAVRRLSLSLLEYLSGNEERLKGAAWLAVVARTEETRQGQGPPFLLTVEGGRGRIGPFGPKTYYQAPFLIPGKRYTIVVAPFLNTSGVRDAADIIRMEFIAQLAAMKNLSVVDPGVLREKMLASRIIMLDSISLADADLIFGGLDADLLLTGKVEDYYDYQGPEGTPHVRFKVSLIERKGGTLVWTSDSGNTGDDKVVIFDFGKIRTAQGLASRMIRDIVQQLFSGPYIRTSKGVS